MEVLKIMSIHKKIIGNTVNKTIDLVCVAPDPIVRFALDVGLFFKSPELRKKYGLNLRCNKRDITTIEGKKQIHLDVDADISQEGLKKLLKKWT